jgi:prophage antirepressor-like protein
MNDIEIFKNEEFGEVRAIKINGEPFFVGKDVASILGYSNPLKAIRDHVDEEDKGVNETVTPGGTQELIVINESGLYSLILSSKMPNAKKFKHWVTSDVLPTIRKHGAYMTNEVIERTLTDPDYLIQLATTLKEERQARQLAEQTIEKQKPLVDFANQVSDTTDLIDMKTMAKLLKDKNINIGRNRLFEFLRNKKILMSDNQPYQQYVDAGYFKVNEYTFTNRFGQAKTNRQTFVTGKGQLYIAKKVKEFLS